MLFSWLSINFYDSRDQYRSILHFYILWSIMSWLFLIWYLHPLVIYSFTSPVIITRYDIISSIPNLYHSMIKNHTFDITCTLDLTHLMSVFSYVPHHSHTITLFSWPFDTILASLTLSSFFISSIRYHYNLPDLSFTHPSPSSRHINDQSSSLTHLNMYLILWYFVSTLGYYITKRIIQKEG